MRKITSHLLIEDNTSAILEAKRGVEEHPDSVSLKKYLVKAYARGKQEVKALEIYEKNFQAEEHPDLLEEIGWSILEKGFDSTQHVIKLTALIGAYLTHDTRAVKFFQKAFQDKKAPIRALSAKLSADFSDGILKREMKALYKRESSHVVKNELITAFGKMRVKEMKGEIEKFLDHTGATFEQKVSSIQALVMMQDTLTISEIRQLTQAKRAYLRALSAKLAVDQELKGAKSLILPLMGDDHPYVRISAIESLVYLYSKEMRLDEMMYHLKKVLSDPDPEVRVSAAWAAYVLFPTASHYLKACLESDLAQERVLAAAALVHAGKKGVSLAYKMMQKSFDPYVRVNLALGLIGLREHVKDSSHVLYQFLMHNDDLWMTEERQFKILKKSTVPFTDQVPNYPQAVDQITRLHLISLLAIIEDPRAAGAIKEFLRKKSWGVTGFAAAMLLEEGDVAALEHVKELLEDESFNVRLQAALVLAFLGKDEAAVPYLIKAYDDAPHQYKLHILEAMGHIGKKESYPFLLRVIKEPFQVIQTAAASSLILCTRK